VARKKKHEEHENHERWLVSYADFITLLFAFFVVMYAVSSVNEGKYRVLSDSLIAAFRSPTKSIMPIQIGNIVKSPSGTAVELPPMAQNRMIQATRTTPRSGNGGSGSSEEALHRMANDLARAFEPLIAEDLVSIREGQLWLELEIRSAVLFDSGEARIRSDALPIVERVVDILAGVPNSVRVEGYTDNVPISTSQFRSNWDLSAARAGSMVHRLLDRGIDPLRLSLAGYGEYRPIADNATEEGRTRNRRVVLVVLATQDAATAREQQLTLTRQGPDDVGLRLPGQLPSALSIVSASAAGADADHRAVPAAHSNARWPSDRRAAGGVPSFVPGPLLPQVAPPL
jgi:chemotaxis protein MotB